MSLASTVGANLANLINNREAAEDELDIWIAANVRQRDSSGNFIGYFDTADRADILTAWVRAVTAGMLRDGNSAEEVHAWASRQGATTD